MVWDERKVNAASHFAECAFRLKNTLQRLYGVQRMCCKINRCFDCINMFRMLFKGVSFRIRVLRVEVANIHYSTRQHMETFFEKKKMREDSIEKMGRQRIFIELCIHRFKTMYEFQTSYCIWSSIYYQILFYTLRLYAIPSISSFSFSCMVLDAAHTSNEHMHIEMQIM